jgi:hypothetical protein
VNQYLPKGGSLVITPTIWEWDGTASFQDVFRDAVFENGGEIYKGVTGIIQTINPAAGTVAQHQYEAIHDHLVPGLHRLLSDLLGNAEDRPIGSESDGETLSFRPKSIVILADHLDRFTGDDYNLGKGVVEVRYADKGERMDGDYTLRFEVTLSGLFDWKLVRGIGREGVYVIFGGARFGIPSPVYMPEYGGWGRVLDIPPAELDAIPYGKAADGTLLKAMDGRGVWVMEGGKRRGIQSGAILKAHGWKWSDVCIVPPGGLATIPMGEPVSS